MKLTFLTKKRQNKPGSLLKKETHLGDSWKATISWTLSDTKTQGGSSTAFGTSGRVLVKRTKAGVSTTL